jgi:hypothetical protein
MKEQNLQPHESFETSYAADAQRKEPSTWHPFFIALLHASVEVSHTALAETPFSHLSAPILHQTPAAVCVAPGSCLQAWSR